MAQTYRKGYESVMGQKVIKIVLQAQEYSASPYQPHGQPTSYSDYSAPSRQTAPSAAPSYETSAYGYQGPSQVSLSDDV